MSDKFFLYALIVSLLIHAACLSNFLIAHRGVKFWKARPQMSYNIVRPEPVTPAVEQRINEVNPDVLQKIIDPSNVSSENQLTGKVPRHQMQDSLINESGMVEDVKMFERKPERLKGVKVTKEVSVPMLKSEKINTSSYITYYQIVRDRIRERAYSNYTKLSVGEVYVTFVIKEDGSLSGLQILEGKSAANDFLRNVGIKSVQEGAPFPPFPKDLGYPELTFNVSISFQYREE